MQHINTFTNQSKLVDNYCNKVVKTNQKVSTFYFKDNLLYIEFEYNEDFIFQDTVVINMLELISFVAENQNISTYQNNMETPKQYAERKIQEFRGLKGFARVFISNMLYNSYLKEDKDFYQQALRELDLTH